MENLCSFQKKIMLLGMILLLYSCSQDEMISVDLQTNVPQSFTAKKSINKLIVFKGPEVTLGYGKVRSWVSVDGVGNPNEIGIEITPEALLNPERDKNNSPEEHATIVVPLHLKAKQLTPFNHIGLNWNPNGHIPIGVFDVPHFDIHFYMISVEDQMAIPHYSEATDAMFNNYPPDGYMPSDYFTPPADGTAEPQMGKHWLPVNLGDFLPFSKIMIYGSYDGNVIFVEPMITLDYLLSNEDSSTSYSQPENFAKQGNYPTKYNIYHHPVNGNTYITLSDFITRD